MSRVSSILCLVAGLPAAAAAADGAAMRCDIRFENAGAAMTITGLAMGRAGTTGNYRLEARIMSGSNRSLSRQGGRFVIAGARAPAVVSRLTVSAAPRTRVDVELVLESSAENARCNASTL